MTTEYIDFKLSAPVNLRDLGGIPVKDGVLREGLAIRSDDLAYVTEEVAGRLVDGGLTDIIDLRTSLEVSVTGRGILAEFPVAYHHLPLIANVADALAETGSSFSHEAMGEMYARMVEESASQLVTALNVIAYAPGVTAFHCVAGRDRTGVLAAMLLLVLGAGDDDIVADYARTGENMQAIIDRTRPLMAIMWRVLGFDEDAPGTTALLVGSMDISMRLLLATLRGRHGDALAPLRAAGLSDGTISRIRQRALVK